MVSLIVGRCFTLWATRGTLQIHWKFNHLPKAALEWKSRMSLLCISGRWDAATTKVYQGKWLLWDVNLHFQVDKTMSLHFQSCVNPFLGHNVLSKNVDFCICFCTDQLNLYCQRTSHQEVASSVFLSENTSTWWDLRSYSREKCPLVLFHPDGESKYFRFEGHKRCFHFRPRVLGSEKRFPTASDQCKDTLGTHCTIPLENRPGKSVLWDLLPHQLLSWVGRITLSGDFVTLISKPLCFQKMQAF